MNLINQDRVKMKMSLKGAHYSFPRADILREEFVWMLEDYYSKAALSKPFEANGLLVIGPSRIGKTTEIRKLIVEANNGSTLMPDGRPVKIVSVVLKGILNWKDLGIHTLREGLGFSIDRRINQREVWDLVAFQARAQGVIGIHFDECQHIFPKNSKADFGKTINSFKSLLKQPEWPLSLILSGVDELSGHIAADEQLDTLLHRISFKEINPHCNVDIDELNSLCHAYAEKAGLDSAGLSNVDFYQRLSHACLDRWGLVIEFIIEALLLAVRKEDRTVRSEHFCQVFTSRTGRSPGLSPFSIDDFKNYFDRDKLAKEWEKRLKSEGE